MLYHHFRLAWRHLRRHRAFSVINLLGLTSSLVAALLMLSYISYEWSFDRFHEDADRIFRVINDRYQGGQRIQHGTITYAPVGRQMDDDYPEIDGHTQMMPFRDVPVTVGEDVFKVETVLFVDSLFPTLFDFAWLAGDPKQALADPFTAILPASLVEKYFQLGPDAYAEAIGKQFEFGGGGVIQVGAVMQDPPDNSHLQFDMLMSYSSLVRTMGERVVNGWTSSDYWHYIRLAPGVEEAQVEAKLPDFSQRHFRGTEVTGSQEVFYLQPLTEAHLYSDFEYEIGETANGEMIQVILWIAVFLLCIAWINYINLSTTRAMERAREVGVRKVLGANRQQLISQFLLEAISFNTLALVVAWFLVALLMPSFSHWLSADLSLSRLWLVEAAGLPMAVWLGLMWIGGTLLSGWYPAWIMSGYRPMAVLKGRLQHSLQGRWLRRGLVVFQFACSVALVAATFTVYRQVQFMQQRDLGLNLTQTLAVDGPAREQFDSTYIDRADLLVHALTQLPGVVHASASRAVPGDGLGRTFDLRLMGQPRSQALTALHLDVDYHYLDTYGIRLLAGRNFERRDHSPNWDELHTVMINRSLLHQLGFEQAEAAIGQQVTWAEKNWEIVGVTDNFHQVGLQNAIEPMLIRPLYSTDGYFSVRMQTTDPQAVMAAVAQTYREFFPGNAFVAQFVEDSFRRQYQREERLGELLAGLAGLALLIGCLGLLGLASYSAVQRTKEIGIRKVLGASLSQLLVLLGRELLLLVLIAGALGLPLAVYGLEEWLSDFAYRIELSWLWLIWPLLVVVIMAIGSVAYQTWRTANLNPVEALRDE